MAEGTSGYNFTIDIFEETTVKVEKPMVAPIATAEKATEAWCWNLRDGGRWRSRRRRAGHRLLKLGRRGRRWPDGRRRRG